MKLSKPIYSIIIMISCNVILLSGQTTDEIRNHLHSSSWYPVIFENTQLSYVQFLVETVLNCQNEEYKSENEIRCSDEKLKDIKTYFDMKLFQHERVSYDYGFSYFVYRDRNTTDRKKIDVDYNKRSIIIGSDEKLEKGDQIAALRIDYIDAHTLKLNGIIGEMVLPILGENGLDKREVSFHHTSYSTSYQIKALESKCSCKLSETIEILKKIK